MGAQDRENLPTPEGKISLLPKGVMIPFIVLFLQYDYGHDGPLSDKTQFPIQCTCIMVIWYLIVF